MELVDFWLSEEIFDWHVAYGDGGRLSDIAKVERPYEILSHARQLIESDDSSFVRADALSNIKRSINIRLQHIESLYKFSNIFPRKTGALERLEIIGLAKPFLIKHLFALRNDVEHNDSEPPSIARLSELLDIGWYFLKATDSACKLVPRGVSFKCENGSFARDPSLSITVSPSPEKHDSVEVVGWLMLQHLHLTSGPGLLHLHLQECRKRPLGPMSEEADDQIAYMVNRHRGDDERWIEGSLATSAIIQQRLWRLILEVN